MIPGRKILGVSLSFHFLQHKREMENFDNKKRVLLLLTKSKLIKDFNVIRLEKQQKDVSWTILSLHLLNFLIGYSNNVFQPQITFLLYLFIHLVYNENPKTEKKYKSNDRQSLYHRASKWDFNNILIVHLFTRINIVLLQFHADRSKYRYGLTYVRTMKAVFYTLTISHSSFLVLILYVYFTIMCPSTGYVFTHRYKDRHSEIKY